MTSSESDKLLKNLSPLLSDLFTVATTYNHGDRLILSLAYRFDRDKSQKVLEDRLELAGYTFKTRATQDVLILEVNPKRKIKIPRLNIILFFITLLSVYIVPVLFKNLPTAMAEALDPATESLGFFDEIALLAKALPEAFKGTLTDLGNGAGISFTLAMISILFVHEMGHFIASRRRGIITSWPYFIPAPNIIGTFGAIIKSKSPFWNRRDLIEVGAAGPIAGWIVAILWLVYGLSQSTILPPESIGIKDLPFSLEGESILMRMLMPALVGVAPEGSFYMLTEAAFAGWVGLLVTAINLLPIGQLDGGHIIYGLARHIQRRLAVIAMAGLFILGFDSPIWWVFGVFGLVFGVGHPPTMDDRKKLSRTAVIMGGISLLILIISFTPVPFQ